MTNQPPPSDPKLPRDADSPVELHENLVAYLDGELPETAVRDVEQQLAQNPLLRRNVEAYQKAWGTARRTTADQGDRAIYHPDGRFTQDRNESHCRQPDRCNFDQYRRSPFAAASIPAQHWCGNDTSSGDRGVVPGSGRFGSSRLSDHKPNGPTLYRPPAGRFPGD